MSSIDEWLEQFKDRWIAKDVRGVLELFTDSVDYYETPSQKLDGKEALREEWKSVKDQEDINLDFEVYSRACSKFTVKWELEYTDTESQNNLKGIYLIELNKDGKCEEFWQYCQSE